MAKSNKHYKCCIVRLIVCLLLALSIINYYGSETLLASVIINNETTVNDTDNGDKLLQFLTSPYYLHIINDLNTSWTRNETLLHALFIDDVDRHQDNNHIYTHKYCMTLETGLGNVLSNYWTARAAAFLSGPNSSFIFWTGEGCEMGRSYEFFLNKYENQSLCVYSHISYP